MSLQEYSFIAQEIDLKLRLDKVLVLHFPDFTRQFFQKLFKEQKVLVDRKVVKSNVLLSFGQKVEVFIPKPKVLNLEAKKIPLDIVFENKDLLVINKQAGLVTHPGVGDVHIDDSLVNGIIYHCKGELSGISGVMRPGIVHRLDKDTSGLMIVAKNDFAHQFLAAQLKNHEIEKTYFALLVGHLEPSNGSIEAPIGRSELDRKKMAVVSESKGKKALTHYHVLEYFNKHQPIETAYTFIKIRLVTGRTHQIRVHFSSIGFPLVGDPLYGQGKLNNFFDQRLNFHRQFLHAGELSFVLPDTKKRVTFEATLPHDLKKVLDFIRPSTDFKL